MTGWNSAGSPLLMFFLGLEGVVQWMLRRSKRRASWRRTNGRRWVLDS